MEAEEASRYFPYILMGITNFVFDDDEADSVMEEFLDSLDSAEEEGLEQSLVEGETMELVFRDEEDVFLGEEDAVWYQASEGEPEEEAENWEEHLNKEIVFLKEEILMLRERIHCMEKEKITKELEFSTKKKNEELKEELAELRSIFTDLGIDCQEVESVNEDEEAHNYVLSETTDDRKYVEFQNQSKERMEMFSAVVKVEDFDMDMKTKMEGQIVLAENKNYYPTAEEVYGEGVETLVMDEDAQSLEQPIIKPEVGVKDFSTYVSTDFLFGLMSNPILHDKTMMLVEQTHHISTLDVHNVKHMRYTDRERIAISVALGSNGRRFFTPWSTRDLERVADPTLEISVQHFIAALSSGVQPLQNFKVFSHAHLGESEKSKLPQAFGVQRQSIGENMQGHQIRLSECLVGDDTAILYSLFGKLLGSIDDEDLVFVAAEPFEEHLVLSKDEVMGKCIIPHGSIPKRLDVDGRCAEFGISREEIKEHGLNNESQKSPDEEIKKIVLKLVLEFLAAEVLELAVRNDEDLSKLLGFVTIANGGYDNGMGRIEAIVRGQGNNAEQLENYAKIEELINSVAIFGTKVTDVKNEQGGTLDKRIVNSDLAWRRLIRCVREQSLAKLKSSMSLVMM